MSDQNPGDQNIAAVYPLTPLQEGMLFHSVRDPEGDAYQIQLSCTLRGELDEETFRRAWALLVERHAVLRTFFTWENRERPLQVVRKQVEIPFASEDWRDATAEERDRLWLERLAADRTRKFDFTKAPLMRLALFRLTEGESRLLWSLHHMLLDGWSGRLLLRLVVETYAALRRGEAIALPPARPYEDYVRWLRDRDLEPAREHWRSVLTGFARPTPLPGPFSMRDGENARSHRFREATLPATTFEWLAKRCRELHITPYTAVLGAWALLLNRMSGDSDVVFGTTVTVRPAEATDVDSGIGLYLNTVPVRVRVGNGDRVDEWLRSIQSEQAAGREYDFTPLTVVQSASEAGASQPLFESIVIYERFPEGLDAGSSQSELSVADVELDEHSNYPLALIAIPSADFAFRLVYETSRYDAAAAGTLLARLGTALDNLLDPRAKVGSVSVLPADERELLRKWGRPRAAVTDAPDVLDSFARPVRSRPADVAVRDQDRSLTLRELDARSSQLAHRLIAMGAGPGRFVPIVLDRSAAMVTAILAVLKAGAAYSPIDPAWPDSRIQSLVEELSQASGESGTVVLGTGSALRGFARALDVADETCFEGPAEAPPVRWSPSDPAYVIYTSGSTGAPKGVVVERRGLAASTAARGLYYGDQPQSFLLLSPPAVDSAIAGLYWALSTGAKLVLPEPRAEQDVAGLARLIETEGVSHLLAVPSLYRLLLELSPPGTLDSLSCAVVAGEACGEDLVRLHRKRLPNAELHNEYGPAEGTVWATAACLSTDPPPTTVGRPVAHAEVHVLDGAGRLTPIGAACEIHIGGMAVARGYLGQPELTRQRFTHHPAVSNARLYATGDRGRWLPDGRLEFLGRADGQVKIRGFRVEPGEVSRTLEAHSGVREAAVVAVDAAGQGAEKRLAAFYAGDAEPAELKSFLAGRLPDYMLPASIAALRELPRGASGKLDLTALAADAASATPAPKEAEVKVAPRNETEAALARIWRSLLETETVSVHDNFFALGGDSLLSIRAIARARREGIEITPRDFFDSPTIASLAGGARGDEVSAHLASSPRSEAPLTPIQQWFFERHTVEPGQWNQSVLLTFPEETEEGRLRQALSVLWVRHPAFRLRFGGSKQVFEASSAPLPLQSRTAQAGEIERLCEQAQASLDLEHGPLSRFLWLDLGPGQEKLLLLTVHHTAVDVASWSILLQDLDAAVRGSPLRPSRSATPEQWARRLSERADEFAADAAFWAAIPDVSEAPMRWDRPYDREQDLAGTARTVEVALEHDTRSDGRVDDVILAALTQAWAQWCGEPRLLIDVEGHGRDALADELDVSETVGWFTAAAPVELVLERGATTNQALAAVSRRLAETRARAAGWGVLRYLQRVPELVSKAPPQVAFNYMGRTASPAPEDAVFRIADEPRGAERHPNGLRAYPLEINSLIEGSRLVLRFAYQPAFHDRLTIEALASATVAELQRMAASPQKKADSAESDMEKAARLLDDLFD